MEFNFAREKVQPDKIIQIYVSDDLYSQAAAYVLHDFGSPDAQLNIIVPWLPDRIDYTGNVVVCTTNMAMACQIALRFTKANVLVVSYFGASNPKMFDKKKNITIVNARNRALSTWMLFYCTGICNFSQNTPQIIRDIEIYFSLETQRHLIVRNEAMQTAESVVLAMKKFPFEYDAFRCANHECFRDVMIGFGRRIGVEREACAQKNLLCSYRLDKPWFGFNISAFNDSENTLVMVRLTALKSADPACHGMMAYRVVGVEEIECFLFIKATEPAHVGISQTMIKYKGSRIKNAALEFNGVISFVFCGSLSKLHKWSPSAK